MKFLGFILTSLLVSCSFGSFVVPNGSVTAVKMSPGGAGSGAILNAGLAATVGASAMTVSVQTASAATPTAADSILVSFRSSTAGSGPYSSLRVASALSVVIPSGATLGQPSGIAQPTYVYLQNNVGSVQACVSSFGAFDEGSPQTSTSISGVSTSATALYCTTGVTGPVRLLGRFVSSQASAGTWASNPSEISVVPFSLNPVLSGGSGNKHEDALISCGNSGSTITGSNPNWTISNGGAAGTCTVNFNVPYSTFYGCTCQLVSGSPASTDSVCWITAQSSSSVTFKRIVATVDTNGTLSITCGGK